MATVLVTGGAGYIGSHVCKLLAAAGHIPVTYDNLARGHADACIHGPLVVGDLADCAMLNKAFQQYRPSSVLHFAALAYVGESMRAPNQYYETNVGGTLALLNTMHAYGVDHLVFSSSCATYGIPAEMPVTEEAEQRPINPYGASKLMVERILMDADAAYGIRSVALRYFNAAGADPDGQLGERHDPETHALPLAILAALGQTDEFHLFGTDYPTPDGSAIRDYIHVMDLADAHVRALDYLADGNPTTAFNLGTGQGTSLFDLIATVEWVTGRRVPLKKAPRRAGDPPVLVAHAARAAAILGWQPSHGFHDIVATAASWHARTLDLQIPGALALSPPAEQPLSA